MNLAGKVNVTKKSDERVKVKGLPKKGRKMGREKERMRQTAVKCNGHIWS